MGPVITGVSLPLVAPIPATALLCELDDGELIRDSLRIRDHELVEYSRLAPVVHVPDLDDATAATCRQQRAVWRKADFRHFSRVAAEFCDWRRRADLIPQPT